MSPEDDAVTVLMIDGPRGEVEILVKALRKAGLTAIPAPAMSATNALLRLIDHPDESILLLFRSAPSRAS